MKRGAFGMVVITMALIGLAGPVKADPWWTGTGEDHLVSYSEMFTEARALSVSSSDDGRIFAAWLEYDETSGGIVPHFGEMLDAENELAPSPWTSAERDYPIEFLEESLSPLEGSSSSLALGGPLPDEPKKMTHLFFTWTRCVHNDIDHQRSQFEVWLTRATIDVDPETGEHVIVEMGHDRISREYGPGQEWVDARSPQVSLHFADNWTIPDLTIHWRELDSVGGGNYEFRLHQVQFPSHQSPPVTSDTIPAPTSYYTMCAGISSERIDEDTWVAGMYLNSITQRVDLFAAPDPRMPTDWRLVYAADAQNGGCTEAVITRSNDGLAEPIIHFLTSTQSKLNPPATGTTASWFSRRSFGTWETNVVYSIQSEGNMEGAGIVAKSNTVHLSWTASDVVEDSMREAFIMSSDTHGQYWDGPVMSSFVGSSFNKAGNTVLIMDHYRRTTVLWLEKVAIDRRCEVIASHLVSG